jgi:hypothetical protein
MSSTRALRRIFWIDAFSALAGGLFTLSLRGFLSKLHAMPLGLLTLLGIVSVGYSSIGFVLATRKRRTANAVGVLAMANWAWAIVCAALVAYGVGRATVFGIAHFAFEGAYVTALGIIEWRNRHVLARGQSETSD